MIFHGSGPVFHGSRPVFMVFHGSRLVFHGSRPEFHGSRPVFMVFHGSRLVFHGFSWFQVCFSWFQVCFSWFFMVFMAPETRLQWFVMGGIYYIFFRASSLVLALFVLFMYLRGLSRMNVLVLVLRMPLTMQGLVKAVIRSSGPRRLAVWIFLSMFILFIFNTLTLDRSTLPSRALEARIMRGAIIV